MTRRRIFLLPLLALVLAAPTRGDELPIVVLIGQSKATASRLQEARKRLAERKWSEAIEAIQAILHSDGDDLVPVSADHCVRAARLCRMQLAALPPEALRLYRQRYEAQADKMLQRANAERDPLLLRKIVEEAFATRAAEKAIDRLGDLAFERGRFAEAEEWWRLLAPLPNGAARKPKDSAFVYPDGSLDPARLQAKQLLARLFAGPGEEWKSELERFRSRHGKSEGVLAGRKGRYADLLQVLAEERQQESAAAGDWLTFAGSPQRNGSIPAAEDIFDRLSALLRDGPTWRFNLETRRRQEGAPPPAANAAQARSLAFHPLIVGHQVLVADARYVTAYDLTNGQSRQWYDVAEAGGGKPNLKLPTPPDLRYTLTAAGDRLYARLGDQSIGVPAPVPPLPGAPRFRPAAPQPREVETFLACMDLRPDRLGEHLRWRIRGRTHDHTIYEGAPLATEERISIACRRYQNGRCINAIDCYPADGSSEPPLRWRRDVCETDAPKAGEGHYRHPVLTQAGTQVVYCTHTGVIVAVDADSGRTNWAVRYPRRPANKNAKTWTDLTPPLFAAGRLYVAPADSDHLLCLDAMTGHTLWEREAMKVVHLLGIGRGRLIFTTSEGLRALGAADGLDSTGWMVPGAGGSLPPAGRGLLIGDLVLWPTVRKRDDFSSSMQTVVYAVRQSDGQPAGDPSMLHRLPAGNLACANGILTATDRHVLYAFVPPRLLLPARKSEVRRRPNSVSSRLALGRAEADAGLLSQALETFRRAESLALELRESKRLIEKARSEQQRILLESAHWAAKSQRWQTAASAIAQAVRVPLSARARLHALLKAAQIWKESGQSVRTRAVWEAILADKELRSIQVLDRNNTPQSVAARARAHLRRETASPQRKQGNDKPLPVPRTDSHLPLFRSWHAVLGNDEWVLSGWREMDPDLLLTGSSTEARLLCRSTRDGAILWQHPLPFVPRWAGRHADTIVTGGESGAAALRRSDGELLWHFSAPVSGFYPTSPIDDVRVIQDPQTPQSLTSFHLVSGRLFFLQGQRRLFALDAETGKVLWHHWAPDGGFRFPYPMGCFSPHYHGGAQTVLIQMSGQRWLLDAATGRILQRMPDSRDLWLRPPLQLDEHTLCVITDNRHIELLDALTGRTRWTHSLRGGTTLSGEAPLVLSRGHVLLLVMPANIGYFLQRLDRTSGKPLWSQPLLLSMKSLSASAFALEDDALYCVEDRTLCARSLTDGRIVWQHSLHGADAWQLHHVGDYLAVHPALFVRQGQFRFRSVLGAVQWQIGALRAPEAVFTVSGRDAKTGQLIERWNFRLATPARTICETRTTRKDRGRSYLIRTSPLLASADGPVVRLDSPRPFVAVGGDVWGLNPSMNDE